MTKYKYLRKNGIFVSFSGDSNLFVLTTAILRGMTQRTITEGNDCSQFVDNNETIGYAQFYPKEARIKIWGDKLLRKSFKSPSLKKLYNTRI